MERKQIALSELISPCKRCSKRKLGCHSNCDAYIIYKINLEEEKRKTGKNAYDLYRGQREKF